MSRTKTLRRSTRTREGIFSTASISKRAMLLAEKGAYGHQKEESEPENTPRYCGGIRTTYAAQSSSSSQSRNCFSAGSSMRRDGSVAEREAPGRPYTGFAEPIEGTEPCRR